MFITGTAFLIAIITTLYYKLTGQSLIYSKNEILFPILAGVFTGIVGIFYLIMYSKNAPLSVGLLLGLTILKEEFNIIKIVGVTITTIGLIILSRS